MPNTPHTDDERRGPTETPDQAEVDRSRQQGVGFGARELDLQGDPEGANAPEDRPVRPSNPA